MIIYIYIYKSISTRCAKKKPIYIMQLSTIETFLLKKKIENEGIHLY